MRFPNDDDTHDGLSRDKDHRKPAPSQSTRFLQTDDVATRSQEKFIGDDDNLKKEGTMYQIRGWPDTASRLRKRTVWTHLSLIWAVVVTLLPIIFLGESGSRLQALTLMR